MTLLAAGLPENLRAPGRFGVLVEDDVFDICKRLKEEIPDHEILVYLMPDEAYKKWSIVEVLPGHREELIYRVDELDARVIRDCQRFIKIPLRDRLAEAEKEEDKFREEQTQQMRDALYEKVGGPMWIDLERCGFIQRPVSFPKVTKTAQRYRGQRDAAERHS